MKMYFLKRLLSLIPVLFIVSIVIFMIIHLTPGDPASLVLGEEATEEQIQALRANMGLDLPIVTQYFHWIGNALQGDLGTSYFMRQPVTEAIVSHLAPTISVAIIAGTISLLISIPIGILAATRRGTNTDRTVMGISLIGMSVPSFLLGLFLILLFGVKLRWLPVAGYQPITDGFLGHIKYLILPSIALGSMHAALIARMTRSSLLEVLNMNYIKTARSKGVHEYLIITRHTLRNAFLPILTVIGQTFGSLIAGAVVTETIFNIPGIGQLIINSVERRDYAVIQGVVLFVTCTYVLINLIVDLLYGVIDPRVRLNKK
ncbi:ABC transporter permease [Sporosarcina luteola]|uniref:ABC transporter permease n=1 Tax=Sporosarcina luteola TaxID=582850 RepID=UPI00203DF370|nr:ABC transporter permease [Sporosarcina luteola]MCM3636618.1 ABC transporter permease [Sporosarcina luteola]